MSRLSRLLLFACGLFSLPSTAFAQFGNVLTGPQVTLERKDHTIAIQIDGQDFTIFHVAPTQAKPYFHPVYGPGGTVVTRPIVPGEKDHPHHKGIWSSVDEVGECKHWMERDKIVNRGVQIMAAKANPARLMIENLWLDEKSEPILHETADVRIFANRLMIFDFVLTPARDSVALHDTKEGFFGLRIAESMREKQGGTITNADGKKTSKECWGQPSAWVDYFGKVDDKVLGVTLMDSPGNFRPSRYHVRDYGLFTISPFGEGAYQNNKNLADPIVLDASRRQVRLSYGLYVHDGDTETGKVAEVYQQFLKGVK